MYFLSQNERLFPQPSIHNTKIELNNGEKRENSRKSHLILARLHCRTVVGLCSAEYLGLDLISLKMQLRFLETMQTRESMWRMEKKDEVRSGVRGLRNGE